MKKILVFLALIGCGKQTKDTNVECSDCQPSAPSKPSCELIQKSEYIYHYVCGSTVEVIDISPKIVVNNNTNVNVTTSSDSGSSNVNNVTNKSSTDANATNYNTNNVNNSTGCSTCPPPTDTSCN